MDNFDVETFLIGLNGKTQKDALGEMLRKSEALRQLSEELKKSTDYESQRKARQYREWSDSLPPDSITIDGFSEDPFVYP